MTITTKENASGRICAYFVDGVKTRKGEINSLIYAAAYAGKTIFVDYIVGQEFKALTRSYYRNMKVVFTREIDGYTLMTEAAAEFFGEKIIEGFSGAYYGLNVCRVTLPLCTETDTALESENIADLDDYAVTPEAQDVATDAEIQAATSRNEIATVGAELPNGHITVDSGVKAFELVSKYFPQGLHFCKASKGFNREDVFSYSDVKENLFAIATCTPDNSRVEVVEVIDTKESGSKRKRLFIVIEHQAEHGVKIGDDNYEPNFSWESVNKAIEQVMTDRDEVFDELEKAQVDLEVPQSFINYLNSEADRLLREYYANVLKLLKGNQDD